VRRRGLALAATAALALTTFACTADRPDGAENGAATSTTLDPYGNDPSHDEGTRLEVCRDGAAALRPGRAKLAAFIAERWPAVHEVLGYECREIDDPSRDGCDREVEPERSSCWSTHASGRAIDVVVGGAPDAASPDGARLGDEIATAFLAERSGGAHHLARITGVQEIIWNGRCWHADDAHVTDAPAMEPCGIRGHSNHVHLTLSDDGADARTSWYR
jgi:hypothetical protein